jgi:hypothetical protein
MNNAQAKKAVANILHKWYAGSDYDKCPNGPGCGLMKSCIDIADRIVNTVKQYDYEDQ